MSALHGSYCGKQATQTLYQGSQNDEQQSLPTVQGAPLAVVPAPTQAVSQMKVYGSHLPEQQSWFTAHTSPLGRQETQV